jgi:hypothetical protein
VRVLSAFCLRKCGCCAKLIVVVLSWPQYVDELLEDMGLESERSGGNWLTWPFKVIDLSEIEHLSEERRRKREQKRAE